MTDKERRAWTELRSWIVDGYAPSSPLLEAIDYLLAEEPDNPEPFRGIDQAFDKPEPLNAPPPDDMPCWVWDYPTERGRVVWLGCDVDECDHWQPCFVPLDAKPGSVWFLWKNGSVGFAPKDYQPEACDREQSRYIFVVPEVNP